MGYMHDPNAPPEPKSVMTAELQARIQTLEMLLRVAIVELMDVETESAQAAVLRIEGALKKT